MGIDAGKVGVLLEMRLLVVVMVVFDWSAWRLTKRKPLTFGLSVGFVAGPWEEVVAINELNAETSTLIPLVALPESGGSSTGHKENCRLMVSQYKSITRRRN